MIVWLKEKSIDQSIKIILFIISPFLSFIYSLKRINTRSSYIVFFLFAVFFGMSFTVGNIRTESSLDGISYRADFENYKNVSYNDFSTKFSNYISFKGNKDFYFDTVAFLTSRFTDNYHILFMFFAIVFAFFSLKSFKFFTSEDNFDTSFSCYALAYLFMANDIFNINRVRFFTAAWIGVYALFKIFIGKDKRYFILLLLTPFFHGSYWLLIAIVIISFLLMKFEKAWIILFVISFFASTIAVDLLDNISEIAPPSIQKMINTYANYQYIDNKSNQQTTYNLLNKSFSFLVRVYINFVVLLFIKNSKIIKENHKSKYLYLFLLVYMVFMNFIRIIPTLSDRYLINAYPLIAYIWLVNFKGVKYKFAIYILPLIFMLFIYHQINFYLMVLDPDFYISSPIYLFYKNLIAYY